MRLSGFASVVLAIKTVERIVSWSTKQTDNESVYSATVFLWLSSELLRIFTSNALCKYFFRAFLADHVESVLAFHIVCRQTPDISYWNKNAYIYFFFFSWSMPDDLLWQRLLWELVKSTIHKSTPWWKIRLHCNCCFSPLSCGWRFRCSLWWSVCLVLAMRDSVAKRDYDAFAIILHWKRNPLLISCWKCRASFLPIHIYTNLILCLLPPVFASWLEQSRCNP